jgi:hypothetical protein
VLTGSLERPGAEITGGEGPAAAERVHLIEEFARLGGGACSCRESVGGNR